MKKTILVLFLLFSLLAKSQVGIVYYGHIESPGMGSSVGKDFNAYLTFNTNKSYYVTAKDSLENSPNQKSSHSYSSKNGNKNVIANGSPLSIQGKQVSYDRKQNTLLWNVLEGKMIYVKESNPKQKWIITKEKKRIGAYSCTKATTFFRGRNYTAWYTNAIPLPYGPWKLNGLPGLILEAYDTDKEMYLYFKSVEYPAKNIVKVDGIKKVLNEVINWWSIDSFMKFRIKGMEDANTRSILDAKKYNWPSSEPTKMVEAYIESFD